MIPDYETTKANQTKQAPNTAPGQQGAIPAHQTAHQTAGASAAVVNAKAAAGVTGALVAAVATVLWLTVPVGGPVRTLEWQYPAAAVWSVAAFQVERAPSPAGPWTLETLVSTGEVWQTGPDLTYRVPVPATGAAGWFRVGAIGHYE